MDAGGAQEALSLNAEAFDTDQFRERGSCCLYFIYLSTDHDQIIMDSPKYSNHTNGPCYTKWYTHTHTSKVMNLRTGLVARMGSMVKTDGEKPERELTRII